MFGLRTTPCNPIPGSVENRDPIVIHFDKSVVKVDYGTITLTETHTKPEMLLYL